MIDAWKARKLSETRDIFTLRIIRAPRLLDIPRESDSVPKQKSFFWLEVLVLHTSPASRIIVRSVYLESRRRSNHHVATPSLFDMITTASGPSCRSLRVPSRLLDLCRPVGPRRDSGQLLTP